MSSLDGITTLQPEEMWPKTTLEKITDLSSAEALALLPKVGLILAHEASSWAYHCTIVQSDDYSALLARAYYAGADANATKEMAIHHVGEKMPARFAVLSRKTRGQTLEPLSGILRVLRDQVQRLGDRHQGIYNDVFTKAVLQQEALLTELEEVRGAQLRQLQMMMVIGMEESQITETKHVVAFVGAMVELGVDVDGVLVEEDGEESDAGSEE